MPRSYSRTRLGDEFFENPKARQMEEMRDKTRGKRRILYDCFNAEVTEDRRVKCRMGHPFAASTEGTILLISVLRGGTPRVCQTCNDYDDGGEPSG